MAQKWLKQDFQCKVDDIIENVDNYYVAFTENDTFYGPSLYFHHQALNTDFSDVFDNKIQMIYAVLTSWGMHRIGSGGSKMQDFKTFYDSLKSHKKSIEHLRKIKIDQLNETDWEKIKNLFESIKIMKSQTKIVGNSKVLAHLIPNLLAPIDRQYTLYYLFGQKNIENDLGFEWNLFRKIHEEFYHPIVKNELYIEKIKILTEEKENPWNTSPIKIVDNLVIGAVIAGKENE